MYCTRGPGSIVGIATGCGLDGPGIESRWGVRFSPPVQTVPGAHPASCTLCTGSFLGVKSGWGMMLTPHPLLVPRSWKGRAIPLLPLWAIWPVQGCTLPYLMYCTHNLHHIQQLCASRKQEYLSSSYTISWKSVKWELSFDMWTDIDEASSHFLQFCECA